jgi:hypothetical protein
MVEEEKVISFECWVDHICNFLNEYGWDNGQNLFVEKLDWNPKNEDYDSSSLVDVIDTAVGLGFKIEVKQVSTCIEGKALIVTYLMDLYHPCLSKSEWYKVKCKKCDKPYTYGELSNSGLCAGCQDYEDKQ